MQQLAQIQQCCRPRATRAHSEAKPAQHASKLDNTGHANMHNQLPSPQTTSGILIAAKLPWVQQASLGAAPDFPIIARPQRPRRLLYSGLGHGARSPAQNDSSWRSETSTGLELGYLNFLSSRTASWTCICCVHASCISPPQPSCNNHITPFTHHPARQPVPFPATVQLCTSSFQQPVTWAFVGASRLQISWAPHPPVLDVLLA